jgi:hypothetical protein
MRRRDACAQSDRYQQGAQSRLSHVSTRRSGRFDVMSRIRARLPGGGGSLGRTGLPRNREFFAFFGEKQAPDAVLAADLSKFDHCLNGLEAPPGCFLLLRKTGN